MKREEIMFKLVKKELSLCVHPTSILFLSFCLFIFIPNYPYEVMFFFSGLSIFFTRLSVRENGDLAFSVALPVKKSHVPLAAIFTAGIFQIALLLLAAVCVAVKECTFPVEAQINLSGNIANLAFIGCGAMLLGTFNLLFFPLYFKKPDKVGLPFVAAAAAIFVLIAMLITIRFVLPPSVNVFNTVDPAFLGAKLSALALGLCLYAGFTALSACLSVRLFRRVDL